MSMAANLSEQKKYIRWSLCGAIFSLISKKTEIILEGWTQFHFLNIHNSQNKKKVFETSDKHNIQYSASHSCGKYQEWNLIK